MPATMKRGILAFVVLAGLLHSSDASAQPSPSCSISATAVSFGTYNVFSGSDVDSTGTISYRCNAQASNITISLSRGSSSSYDPRQMSKGSERLNYNLFTNAARTTVWGDGTSGTSVYAIAHPANNRNVNLTVYGRVPAGQDVSAGTFSDTVTAVINF